MLFLGASALFFVAHGWLLNYEVDIAGQVVLHVFIGYFTLPGFNALSIIIIGTYRSNPVTASAANNFVRCFFSAGASMVVNSMIDAMGPSWAFTFVGLVNLLLMPTLLAVMKWGPEWRGAEKRKVEEQNKRGHEKKAKKE